LFQKLSQKHRQAAAQYREASGYADRQLASARAQFNVVETYPAVPHAASVDSASAGPFSHLGYQGQAAYFSFLGAISTPIADKGTSTTTGQGPQRYPVQA